MKIGIIGTRGIPNQYGGFEQFAAHAAPELVNRGHTVIVYNSSLHPYREEEWKGVKIIRRTDPEKIFGTAGQFIYDLNCIMDCRKRNFDVIIQLGYTSSSLWSFLFPKQSVIITNMDGLEWKRSKYSGLVQKYLLQAERWAVQNSDHLIADSLGIQEYLQMKYGRRSEFITYGAEIVTDVTESHLLQWGIHKYAYDILIARMEPENNIGLIIGAHLETKNAVPLLIVGDYRDKYGSSLYKKYNSDRIIFIGAEYDMDKLNSLRFFSRFYFHGHSVGGTNPSLLEAMASQSLVIAHDNIFNRSVLESDAFYFKTKRDITDILDSNKNRNEYDHWIANNVERIRRSYSWQQIVNSLENHLKHVLDNR